MIREAADRGLIALFNPEGNPWHGEHGYFSGPEDAGSSGSLRETLQAKHPNVKLWVNETPDTITVDQIVVPKEARSAGTGTAIMQEIVAHADKVQKPVTLTPSSDFGGSVSRLRAFYKRFGFVENKGRNKDFAYRDTMYRRPR